MRRGSMTILPEEVKDSAMRQENKMMLWDTLDILDRGFYTAGGKKVRLKLTRAQMEEADVYLPQDIRELSEDKDFEHIHVIGRCGYGCENMDSFSLARKRREQLSFDLDKEGAAPILVLNLANATHPGGGVRNGAKAQEEDLCRKSSLLLSLESEDAKSYYEYNEALDTRMGSDAVIISPNVEIIKDEKGSLLPETVIAAVMTCAAPMLRDGMEGMTQSEYEAMMYGRITGMLKTAAYLGYRHLVLGAFGCGVFQNDARIVSDLFYKALKQFDFDGMKENDMFRRIDFAVLDHSESQYNFKQFSRNFSHFYRDEDQVEIDRALARKKETEVYLDAIRGCIFGGAAGDALGYPVEFQSEEDIFSKYGPGGITAYEKDRKTGKALISDDTQMTLFTANGLLVGDTRLAMRGIRTWPRHYVTDAYLDWLKTQESSMREVNRYQRFTKKGGRSWLLDVPELYDRRAPGNTCLSALHEEENDITYDDYVEAKRNHSKGCGGIMRVAPIAVNEAYSQAWGNWLDMEGAQLAAITHGHSLGYMPAAVLVHILSRIVFSSEDRKIPLKEMILEARDEACRLFEGDPHLPELTAMIDRAVMLAESGSPEDLDNIHRLGEGWVAEETLGIALYCALKYQDDFSAGIIAAVNHNGDSDSTGAVTGNILGALLGYDAIEDKWKKDLELADVILEVADDLCHGCQMSEYSHYRDPDWEAKYMYMHRPAKGHSGKSGESPDGGKSSDGREGTDGSEGRTGQESPGAPAKGTEIRLIKGDITKVSDVEAIVNAANRSLLGGGGVDGAIHRAAGPELLEECRRLHGCNTGEAKLTKACRLPCKYVIHTVGPVWNGGKRNEAKLLADCYRNSLQVAVDHGIRTVAFPSISTGVYSYPPEKAAEVALGAVNAFVEDHPGELDLVEWVLFDRHTYDAYDRALGELTVSKIAGTPALDVINRALRDGLV